MILTGEDVAGRPSLSEVVDDNTEGDLDSDLDNNDLDADFYDYSYNDADKYVNVTDNILTTQLKKRSFVFC